ncbi:hypothetical protein [Devriesea agamarum]|uniref:hypothetical protein n=1 Tax=Devriesea agamarum TaxID=472569 RepID=UPI00071DAF2F|nr:hypothetical protein [Devriesea agamarum]
MSERKTKSSPSKKLSGIRGKVLAWLLIIGIALLVAIPSAILFGAADFIFGTPEKGLITFFGSLGLAALLFLWSFGWDYLRDKWKESRKKD